MAIAAIAPAAGANAGTSPPAPTLSTYANDTRGIVYFGTGTTPAAGVQVVLTFAGSWSGYAEGTPIPFIQPQNAATAALGPWTATIDAAGRTLTLSCAAAPAAAQGSGAYQLGYQVVG